MHYMAKQQQQQDIGTQFSDPELEQLKRYGAAQLGGTQFSEAVEQELEKLQHAREANAKKMKAAMRGGDLGPEQFEQEQVQQTGALQRLAGSAGQAQAAQAQAQMTSPTPPPAPSGTAGVTRPYPAQAKTPNQPEQEQEPEE
jgi:hypothetical protein